MTAHIAVIGGQKGGTSKSTIAQNLAVALAGRGHRVGIIDTDNTQNTSLVWSDTRAVDEALAAIPCEDADAGTLGGLLSAWGERFSHVIVDTGASDSEELRSALLRADIFITPTRPNQADLWTVERADQLYRAARDVNKRLLAWVVISQASSTHPQRAEIAAAANFIKRFPNLKLTRAIVRDRAAYSRALGEGRGVLEYSPRDDKAIAEINHLFAELYDGQIAQL
jgi:chromosome partitioning protein